MTSTVQNLTRLLSTDKIDQKTRVSLFPVEYVANMYILAQLRHLIRLNISFCQMIKRIKSLYTLPSYTI